MPQQLTAQQFDAVVQRVMASAPEGLDEAGFQSLLDTEVAKAETQPALSVSHADSQPSTPDDFPDMPESIRGMMRENPAFRSTARGLMGGGVMTGAPGMAKAGVSTLQKVARRLYGGLLKPKQAVKDSFGGTDAVAGTLLAERAPISSGGLTKMQGRMGDSRAAALKTVADAEASGVQGVTSPDLLGNFPRVVGELRKRADIGQVSELPKVGERGRRLLTMMRRTPTGGDVPLTRAQQLKETAQDAASGAYRAMERGAQKQLGADDLLDEAVARGLRTGIERKVPAVAAHNQRTQSLLGGTRALEDAVEREAGNNMVGGGRDWAALLAGGAGTAASGPAGGVGAAALMRLLATPSTGSRAAIGLNEVGKLPIDEAAARALAVLFSQRSGQE